MSELQRVFINNPTKERMNLSIIIYEYKFNLEKIERMESYLVSIITTEMIEKSTEELKGQNK